MPLAVKCLLGLCWFSQCPAFSCFSPFLLQWHKLGLSYSWKAAGALGPSCWQRHLTACAMLCCTGSHSLLCHSSPSPRQLHRVVRWGHVAWFFPSCPLVGDKSCTTSFFKKWPLCVGLCLYKRKEQETFQTKSPSSSETTGLNFHVYKKTILSSTAE